MISKTLIEQETNKAHQNGYEVTLLYVAINSVKTAIKRVNERV